MYVEWAPSDSLIRPFQKFSLVDSPHLIRSLRCSANTCKDVILRRDFEWSAFLSGTIPLYACIILQSYLALSEKGIS